MSRYSLSLWLICFGLLTFQQAWSCEPMDARYSPYGDIVALNNEMMRGPAASLEYMLDALFARRQGDPETVAVHIRILPDSLMLVVALELTTGEVGRTVSYEVACVGKEWVYEISDSTSADGAYRKWNTRVSLYSSVDPGLVIRRDEHLTSGLIFKTKKFYSMTSTFKRIVETSD